MNSFYPLVGYYPVKATRQASKLEAEEVEITDISIWNHSQFMNSRDKWNDLVLRAGCDPLFLSWQWMSTWWDTFSNPCMELKIVVIESKSSGELYAIAPLYTQKVQLKKLLKLNRIQFIGHSWNGPPTMRTELLEFIVDKKDASPLVKRLCEYIEKKIRWDEFALKDTIRSSETFRQIENVVKSSNCALRVRDEYINYHLNPKDCFSNYLSGLSGNTRRSLFNKRRKLEELGEIQFSPNGFTEFEEGYTKLDELHKKRWGNPIFFQEGQEFFRRFSVNNNGAFHLDFSVIKCDKNIISIQFNINTSKQRYNIQAGFDPDLSKQLALGSLHFGYEIENCYAKQIDRYHFLAGQGKQSDYKASLTSDGIDIIDCLIVKGLIYKSLYIIYDKISSFLKNESNN